MKLKKTLGVVASITAIAAAIGTAFYFIKDRMNGEALSEDFDDEFDDDFDDNLDETENSDENEMREYTDLNWSSEEPTEDCSEESDEIPCEEPAPVEEIAVCEADQTESTSEEE